MEEEKGGSVAEGFIADIFNKAPEAGVLYDACEGKVLNVNPAFSVLAGYSPEEAAGQVFVSFFAEADLPCFSPGEPLTRRLMLRKRCGDWIPVDAFFSFVFRGKRTEACAFLKDASEFIRLLESFQKSEERFHVLTANCPMGIHFYRIDKGNSLIFAGANPAAERMLGVRIREGKGRPVEEIFPDLAATEAPQRYRLIAREGGVWSTGRLRYRDDRIVDLHAFQSGLGRCAAVFSCIPQNGGL